MAESGKSRRHVKVAPVTEDFKLAQTRAVTFSAPRVGRVRVGYGTCSVQVGLGPWTGGDGTGLQRNW